MVNDWDRHKFKLEKSLEKKNAYKRPTTEVDKAKQILDQHEANQPLHRGLLESWDIMKDFMRNPNKFEESKDYPNFCLLNI